MKNENTQLYFLLAGAIIVVVSAAGFLFYKVQPGLSTLNGLMSSFKEEYPNENFGITMTTHYGEHEVGSTKLIVSLVNSKISSKDELMEIHKFICKKLPEQNLKVDFVTIQPIIKKQYFFFTYEEGQEGISESCNTQ